MRRGAASPFREMPTWPALGKERPTELKSSRLSLSVAAAVGVTSALAWTLWIWLAFAAP